MRRSVPSRKAISTAFVVLSGSVFAIAQNPQLEEKLMALKQEPGDQQAEAGTVHLAGDENNQHQGQRKGHEGLPNPDGERTSAENGNQHQRAQQSGREGRLKEQVVEKKKEEYQEYGQQIGARAKQYTTPNPQLLMQAKQAGNISLQPGGGTVSLVIKNYLKQGDSMAFILDPQFKQLQNVRGSSYLNDPSDAVTISAEFPQLPDGTNHVASTQINGVSKQLTVNEQNSNYQKM